MTWSWTRKGKDAERKQRGKEKYVNAGNFERGKIKGDGD